MIRAECRSRMRTVSISIALRIFLTVFVMWGNITSYQKPNDLKGVAYAVVKCSCSQVTDTQSIDDLSPNISSKSTQYAGCKCMSSRKIRNDTVAETCVNRELYSVLRCNVTVLTEYQQRICWWQCTMFWSQKERSWSDTAWVCQI